jgi:hypothetical protein
MTPGEDRPTREELKVPMGGAVHFVARIATFSDGHGEKIDKPVVEPWRSSINGREHRFATAYRHDCGEVAVTTDDGCCIRLGTMLDHVVPAMNQFDEFVGHIPRHPDNPAAAASIVCSRGGCDKCRRGVEAPIVAEMTEFLRGRLARRKVDDGMRRAFLSAIQELGEASPPGGKAKPRRQVRRSKPRVSVEARKRP